MNRLLKALQAVWGRRPDHVWLPEAWPFVGSEAEATVLPRELRGRGAPVLLGWGAVMSRTCYARTQRKPIAEAFVEAHSTDSQL